MGSGEAHSCGNPKLGVKRTKGSSDVSGVSFDAYVPVPHRVRERIMRNPHVITLLFAHRQQERSDQQEGRRLRDSQGALLDGIRRITLYDY